MTEPFIYRSTQDKLLIFVSARLQECEAERSVARAAIISLNHQPVLFEHLGARPYSPRELYLSRLRDSQAMIAIYRTGYGYIDTSKGMEISGLEDESLFAQNSRLPTLVYVERSPENRDSRLAAMIEKIERGPHTIAFYENATELRDRIRDDLTALITERYISAGQQRGVLQETSANVLARAGVVIDRPDLINEMDTRSRISSVLCLHGPPGIGKTTLAAQFAQSLGAVFIRVSGLAPKDLFSICAKALHEDDFAQASLYSTLGRCT